MNYINSNGSIFTDIEKYSEYIDSGGCGIIHRSGDTILKRYYESTENVYRINKKIFDFLKTIDSPNFIQLYDIYTKSNYPKFLLSKVHIIKFRADAYTAKYYKPVDIDPLYYPKEYLLESFLEIEKIINYLSNNRVAADDLKKKNAVLTDDRIVLIDPDLYSFHKDKHGDVNGLNKLHLLYLLKSFLIDGRCQEDKKLLTKWYKDNYDFNVFSSSDCATDYIANTLKYVKKPVELISKYKNS